MHLSRLLLPALALAALVAAPLRASAEPPLPAPNALVADPDDDDTGPDAGSPRPAATNTRTGNVFLDGKFGVTAPAGTLGPTLPNALGTSRAAANITGTGMSFGGILGVGLTRYVTLEASGGYSLFGAPTGCPHVAGIPDCGGHSYDLGLGLGYHLAQGMAVDPWASFGMGYRAAVFTTNIDVAGAATGSRNDQHYRGFDFARIGLGADFYPVPFFGFGPYFAADIGASLGPPVATVAAGSPPPTGVSTYAFIHFGVRIAFDPFRSAASSSRARSLQAHR